MWTASVNDEDGGHATAAAQISLRDITAQTMRAVLLASPTVAIFTGLRSSSCASLGWRLPVLARHAHQSGGADDQQLPEIPVTLLADPAEPLLATRAIGTRCKAQPRGELTTGSEQRCVRDCCGDR